MRTTPNMGLTTWDALNDYFSHAQLKANFDAIDAHDHSAGRGAPLGPASISGSQIALNSVASSNILDNTIVAGDIAGAELDRLGLSGSGVIRRGAFVPGALTESRTNTAYGTMPTADQVSNVVLPANGLIAVGYQATWQESVDGAARAAIFIGANQLKIGHVAGSPGPELQEAQCPGAVNIDVPLFTYDGGLGGGLSGSTGVAYTGDVTTGQLLGEASVNGSGGFSLIFAAAGTYTVSVQFKASSGSVTRKNPKLWVWTIGF